MLFRNMEDKVEKNKRNHENLSEILEVLRDKIKKERKRSLKRYFFSWFSPICRLKKAYSGKVSLHASVKKASIAVETAFVLPIFFLGAVALISLMDIYKIQTEHLMQLCEKAKETGMYAYALDGNSPENIILPDMFTYSPAASIIPLPEIRMFQTVKVHAWTGKEYGNGGETHKEEAEQMVYVTESGSVYHKNIGCTYLNLSVNHVPGQGVSGLRNRYGEKYSPCETCAKNQNPAGTVYITDTGNRYHNLESCSGLKRTVKMVKYSQVEGTMHVCSRCG